MPGRFSLPGVNAEFSIGKLTSVLAKKTKGDLDRVFKGTSKTREKLSYMDEVLALWNFDGLEDTSWRSSRTPSSASTSARRPR